MAVLRVLELTINPGKRADWLQGTKEVKGIVESEGGNVSYLATTGGGNPSTIFAVSVFEDLNSYGAFNDKMDASEKLGEFTQRQAKSPSSTAVGINILQDIHDEVGDPSDAIENPAVFAIFRQALVPGKRPAFIEMSKAIRDTLRSEGKPVGNANQCIIGDTAMYNRSIAFASTADWAAARSTPLSNDVLGILSAAQADGPMFDSIEALLLRNITASL
jgi:quinol monooxygenase YgiN